MVSNAGTEKKMITEIITSKLVIQS